MLLSAMSALFLVSFGLGAFWPSSNRHDLFFFTFATMAKSMYLGWVLFLFSYFSAAGEAFPIIFVAAAAAAIMLMLQAVREGRVTVPRYIPDRPASAGTLAVLAVCLALAGVQALKPIGDVFTAWDALASWNRWATELYGNEYKPMNTAYPILLPALWSLIYEGQGSADVWFFSRALLSVIPMGVVALAAHVGLRRGIIPFLVLFVPLYFGFIVKEPLFSGYMDQPSAILGLSGLLLAYLSIGEQDLPRRNELLTLSIVVASLAVLTKQHAFFAAFAVCSLVAVMTFRRQVSILRAGGLAAIFLLPVASFLFIYLQEQDTLWGNITALNQVSERAAGETSRLQTGMQTIGAEFPVWVWAMIVFGIVSNLVFIRDPRAVFALFVAGLTIPGFLVYADCCSYSERNGIWILGHLAFAGFVGFSLLCEALRPRLGWAAFLATGQPGDAASPIPLGVAKASALAAIIAALFVTIEWPMDRIHERQVQQQRYRILPRLSVMLARNPQLMTSADIVVTPISLMKYHPDVPKGLRYCLPAKVSCFQNVPPGRTIFATAPWFENPDSEALIERLLQDGTLEFLDEENGMRLYRVTRNPAAE